MAADIIPKVPLFKSLSEEERLQLAQCTTRMSYAEDELIMEQGAEGNSMYILVSGEATAEKDGKAVYTYRNSGDFFGELALSSPGGLRAASVRAVGKAETSCFMIGKKNLDKVMGLSSEMLVERQRTYGTFKHELSGEKTSSVHEFVQTFQDKVTTLPTCVCFLPDCLAPSARPH